MSSAAALLPPVPAPPHDPLSIVLDVRAGWRLSGTVENLEVSPLDGALQLQAMPGWGALADDFGSFGGLVLPDNVALGPECIVLLLDRTGTRLLRFDPCTCAFVPLPCIAGKGDEPRQLDDPGGMTASCGNLYICDSGNRRVLVFGLRGLPLRAIVTQPPDLAQPWRPVAVVGDGRGRIFIGDPDNGCVHVFAASGRRLLALDGLGAVSHLTIDRRGFLYVQIQGDSQVRIINPDTWLDTHLPVETEDEADEVAAHFGKLPFQVTPDGHLRLACGEFDLDGNPVDVGAGTDDGAPVQKVQKTGKLISVALDSKLHRCQWDRLELDGQFPDFTSVRASVYAAETQLPDALVAALLDDEWTACPAVDSIVKPWDCMLRVPPGRYLWLRLDFTSDGLTTPRIHRARLQFPRVSLRRYLPGAFGRDMQAAEFSDRFLAIFDRTFRSIESTIDWQAHFYDPLSSPADDRNRSRDFLSWLATWIGVSLERSWPIARRRRYLKEVGKLLPLRGTLCGLQKNLQLFLGLPQEDQCADTQCGPCTTTKPPAWKPPELVLEHYRLRRWLFLGHGRLGDEARLWGESIVNRSRLDGPAVRGNARVGVTQLKVTQDPKRDPFWVYAHKVTVFAPASFARSPAARRGLDRLIRAERPAHTAYQIVYVEPRFRIGIQSMIGFDSAIGCYPDGNDNVKLGQAKLGRATVLGGDQANDPLSVGQRARIGTTTRLT